MTPDLWIWTFGFLLSVTLFWLKDWKDKVDAAFAAKQQELDILMSTVSDLKVQMARRITIEELTAFRTEMKQDVREAVRNAFMNTKDLS